MVYTWTKKKYVDLVTQQNIWTLKITIIIIIYLLLVYTIC